MELIFTAKTTLESSLITKDKLKLALLLAQLLNKLHNFGLKFHHMLDQSFDDYKYVNLLIIAKNNKNIIKIDLLSSLNLRLFASSRVLYN